MDGPVIHGPDVAQAFPGMAWGSRMVLVPLRQLATGRVFRPVRKVANIDPGIFLMAGPPTQRAKIPLIEFDECHHNALLKWAYDMLRRDLASCSVH
jgi:hypothetical protein